MKAGRWEGVFYVHIRRQFLSGWRLSEENTGARLRQIEIDQDRDHLLVDWGRRWRRGGVCLNLTVVGFSCATTFCLGCISWRSKKEVYYSKISLFSYVPLFSLVNIKCVYSKLLLDTQTSGKCSE